MKKCRIIPISDNEFTLETGGWSFHICLGSHTSGNYIAIPDWGYAPRLQGEMIPYGIENAYQEAKTI